MKNKYIKSYTKANKTLIINENLSEGSMNDLTNLMNELKFVSEFNIELYEAIEVINKLIKMNLEQIIEWRDHIDTNYSTTHLEDFTLRLIDRYCSNTPDIS